MFKVIANDTGSSPIFTSSKYNATLIESVAIMHVFGLIVCFFSIL